MKFHRGLILAASCCFALLLSACGGGRERSDPAQSPLSSPDTTNELQKEGGRLNALELAQIAKTGVLPDPFDGPLLSGAASSKAKSQTKAATHTVAYRFYNTRTGAHFFTTSVAERDNVINTLSSIMNYEGPAFYASSTSGAGLSPVHRFYNTQTGVHFYTISETERAHVTATLPQFTYEGIAYYASTQAGVGFTPLYRFFLPSKGFHFYSNSLTERDNVIANLPQYSYEGIGYYVLQAPSITTALGMPSRLLGGLGAGNAISDMISQQIHPDIIDTYLVGVGPGSWPYWNSPNGAYVTYVSANDKAIGAVPMFTLFQMAQPGEADMIEVNDVAFMTAYWAQAKLMYQKIGATGQPTLVNLEPDFWGFLQGKSGGDPTKVPARVSMVAECASQPDTAVGIAGCLLTLGRMYAPKAKLGFPPSFWGGTATSVGNFMAKVGADKADFIVAQTSDRDAGCFEMPTPVQECEDRGSGPFYWDETNTTSPNFNESLAQWSTVRSILGNLPILFWQTPMGVPSTTPGGTEGHYRDNRVHYMLTNPTQYTAIGTFAIVFSAGGSTSATITTDGGQFANLFNAYLANPAPFPH
ncbi:hypothetical protein ACVC7V_04340 [Hydrogenophaga sp. A37]|uniref:hypothetical protein n=1 Tax=Hydrogenophaga sp. A37 TaxID=1945864 RepID=UPI001179EE11|nr:hypothetical protein [Hydrogenophaga sp. A37]